MVHDPKVTLHRLDTFFNPKLLHKVKEEWSFDQIQNLLLYVKYINLYFCIPLKEMIILKTQ